MLRLTKKQRSIFNAAVKPLKLSTRYLSDGMVQILHHHLNYFATCRHIIDHSKPIQPTNATLQFNKLIKIGGFIKNRINPKLWKFYGASVLTKFGRDEERRQKKVAKRKAKLTKKTEAKSKNKPARTKDTVDEPINFELHFAVEEEPTGTIPVTIAKNSADVMENDSSNLEWNCPATMCGDTSLFADSQIEALLGENNESNGDLMAERNDNHHSEISGDMQTTSDQPSVSSADEPTEKGIDDVNEKIREQLKLLKMGKSENTLFGSKTPTNTAPSSRRSTISLSKRPSFGELRKSLDANNSTSASPSSSQKAQHSSDKDCSDSETAVKPKVITGLINSLFNKLQTINKQSEADSMRTKTTRQLSRASVSETTVPEKVQKLSHCEQRAASVGEPKEKIDPIVATPVELLGFDIGNRDVDVSALLPTPKVSAQSSKAAFISEDLDTFMKENSLDSSVTYQPNIVRKHDDALVTNDAQPPHLATPQRPLSMQRPRTLAEKRMYLQQKNDVNILIVENESTIYHELKKRIRTGIKYDITLIQGVQQADVPFTRDCWRAACWISTSNGKFYYRTVRDADEKEYKLAGSYGDNSTKLVFEFLNPANETRHLLPKPGDCTIICKPIPANIKINNLSEFLRQCEKKPKIESNESKENRYNDIPIKSRLNMFARQLLPAGPRSHKLKAKTRCRSASFDLEFGPLEILSLPRVHLEAWPRIGFPLPDNIRPLLKMVWSESNVITTDRALFAISVVKQPLIIDSNCRKYVRTKPRSFIFDLPYENNERNILIRRRRRKSYQQPPASDCIDDFYTDDKPYSFQANNNAADKIDVECSNILANMIDMVAISLNEPKFVKNDPHLDYVGRMVPIVPGQKNSKKNVNKSSVKYDDPAKLKLMNELKRLNVTVINAVNNTPVTDKPADECTKSFCKFGCICESVNNSKYVQTHCQLESCLFGCICSNTQFGDTFGLKNDIHFLRAQANALLAKEEKEFKSTIVVSDTDMFVLPNSSTANKRSSRKPKRFNSDDTTVNDPEMEAIWGAKRKRRSESKQSVDTVTELPSNLLNDMQHVAVRLERLPDCNIEPWCMIHQLYKCHCKCKSQKGRPFTITIKKSRADTHGGWEVVTARKRQYSFERDNNHASTSTSTSITNSLITHKKTNEHVGSVNSLKNFNIEPIPKMRKTVNAVDVDIGSTARTKPINLTRITKRTEVEWRKLRNECKFAELSHIELLKERIRVCRTYNKAQNILLKTSHAHANLMGKANHLITINKRTITETGATVAKKSQTPPSPPPPPTTATAASSSFPAPTTKVATAFDATSISALKTKHKATNAIQRLNSVISNTMQRLTCNQRQKKILLNPKENKMSFVSWELLLVAFKSRQLFVWDAKMQNNKRALIMTDSFLKPKNTRFRSVININYVNTEELPLVAKMLRNDFTNAKTKYLAVAFIRLSNYWRILGCAHSNLNYLENELVAKPTPEKNPLLSQKINTLFHLLMSSSPGSSAQSSSRIIPTDWSNTSSDIEELDICGLNDTPANAASDESHIKVEDGDNDEIEYVSLFDESNESTSSASKQSNPALASNEMGENSKSNPQYVSENDCSDYDMSTGMSTGMSPTATIDANSFYNYTSAQQFDGDSNVFDAIVVEHFENTKLGLTLPIEMNRNQRLFMLILGKDFTHVWFPTAHKFLSRKRILHAMLESKVKMVPIEISPGHLPKVFVTYTHEHRVFIGPYDRQEKQNVALFMYHNNHMVLSQIFAKRNPHLLLAKSKASWIYPSTGDDNLSVTHIFADGELKDYTEPEFINCDLLENPLLIDNYNNIIRDEFMPSSDIHTRESSISTDDFESNEAATPDEFVSFDSLPLRISSVTCGDDVAFLTDESNHKAVDSDSYIDYSSIALPTIKIPPNPFAEIADRENDSQSPLLIPRAEANQSPICITEAGLSLGETTNLLDPLAQPFKPVHGYIYCPINHQLGYVFVEWTARKTIILYLDILQEITCTYNAANQTQSFPEINVFMQNYLKTQFYAVYPTHLELAWKFVRTQTKFETQTMPSFNRLNTFSVIFKDKIIRMGEDYRAMPNLTSGDIYVADIFKLASHILPTHQVKTMNISDILKKARTVDSELLLKRRKLEKAKTYFQRNLGKVHRATIATKNDQQQ